MKTTTTNSYWKSIQGNVFKFCYLGIVIDFVLSQSYVPWNGVHSDNPIFKTTAGNVGVWVMVLCWHLRIFNAVFFYGFIQAHRKRLHIKERIIIGFVYGGLLLKDSVDFIRNGNHGTTYWEWIILLILLFMTEFFYEVSCLVLNDLRHKIKEWKKEEKLRTKEWDDEV